MRKFNQAPVGVRAAVIAGIFAVAAAAVGVALPRLVDQFFSAASPKLVEAAFVGPKTLRLRLRNVGARTAFLTRAVIHVDRIGVFIPPGIYTAAVFSTANYNVTLPVKPFPYELPIYVSHAIAPNAVDQFDLIFTHEPATAEEFFRGAFPTNDKRFLIYDDYSHYDYVFSFRVRLIYDETRQAIDIARMLFLSGVSGPYNEDYTVASPQPPSRDAQRRLWERFRQKRGLYERNRELVIKVAAEAHLRNPTFAVLEDKLAPHNRSEVRLSSQ